MGIVPGKRKNPLLELALYLWYGFVVMLMTSLGVGLLIKLGILFLCFFIASKAVYGSSIFAISSSWILNITCMLLLFSVLYNAFSARKNMELKEQEYKKRMELQELHLKHEYYEDKLKIEERVKSIYHDFKNHLIFQ